MVTVATFVNLGEAELFKTRLEGSGVFAFIPDEFVARNNWFWITALGGVRVQVAEEDAELAYELFREQQQDAEQTLEIIPCPQCAATEVKQDDFRQRLALGLFALFNLPVPLSKRTYICQKCGHRWKSGALKDA